MTAPAPPAVVSGARRPLQVTCHLATPRWGDTLALARAAEAAGFDAVTGGEHFLMRFGPVSVGFPDRWSHLAALAATTERVALQLLVTCTNFRSPALIAKMADTVDEISGGRLVLGLGAGWNEAEFRAFGFPFDHRVGRFAEAVAIIHALLRTGHVDFAGRYYELRDCALHPAGPRPQGPPLLIGTTGPRMLALTARYADWWDTNFQPQPALPALQAALDAACADVDRDPATLRRSASLRVALPGAAFPGGMPAHLTGTPAELAAGLQGYAAAGFAQVALWLEPNTPAGIAAFAPTLALLDRG
jgi:alkanesulfonate monooxygenase SsuD/methylene tetrahydromethanopterin reductase-like flavin-dependent oxidoreductase (luciferase family)